MTHPPQTPAGWYDDGSGRKRWWDGTAWGQYADVPPPTPPQKSNTGVIIGFVGFLVVLLGLGVLAFVLNITGSSGAEKAHDDLRSAWAECDADQFREVTSRSYRRQVSTSDFDDWCRIDEPTIGKPDETFDDISDFHDWCRDEYGRDCLADPRRTDYYAESLDNFTADADDATVIVARYRDNDGDNQDMAFYYSKVDGDWTLELMWEIEDVYSDEYYDDEYYDDDYYYSY
ncbi:DUF2510 domain-containing protein [Nocardioides sp. AE5]|uniref:DUF2510 domain-containing protein n=1 Tax=Nocardioides sp. AE5 TaxID=2962573 RepID=UPI002882989E|nr:DUF2510 domain-containing protein [Nocardioides sp. AE5]MDT0200387.1 DUF2510 domain-containing protein [Nocardioides sp. AE5]